MRTGSRSAWAWGALDLAVGVLIAAAVVVMIRDQVAHDAFVPGEYFAYFTIQTNLLDVVVLALGAVLLLARGRQSAGYSTLRACAAAYAVLTGVVYNLLLRGLPAAPGDFVTTIHWPNEVVHVVGPLYLAIEWVLHRSQPVPGRSLGALVGAGVAYPVVWVLATLVRGSVTGWYPYDFLDPGGPAGPTGVAAYVAGISAFIALLLGLARIVRAHDPRVRPGGGAPSQPHEADGVKMGS